LRVTAENHHGAVLGGRIEQLLDEVVTRTGTVIPSGGDLDSEALEQPIDEEFRVGAMALAWDSESGLVVIEAQAPVDDTEIAQENLLEDVDEGTGAVRVSLGTE